MRFLWKEQYIGITATVKKPEKTEFMSVTINLLKVEYDDSQAYFDTIVSVNKDLTKSQ